MREGENAGMIECGNVGMSECIKVQTTEHFRKPQSAWGTQRGKYKCS